MKIFRSKTLWFAYALAALGSAQANLPVLQSFITPETYGYLTFGVAIVVALLRVVTTKPLSEK